MTRDARSFIRTLRDNFSTHAALVFADWLDERGEPLADPVRTVSERCRNIINSWKTTAIAGKHWWAKSSRGLAVHEKVAQNLRWLSSQLATILKSPSVLLSRQASLILGAKIVKDWKREIEPAT